MQMFGAVLDGRLDTEGLFAEETPCCALEGLFPLSCTWDLNSGPQACQARTLTSEIRFVLEWILVGS